jgi:hypothetical protein
LADPTLSLHDTDHDDKTSTDTVGLFQLYLDRWSSESEQRVESLTTSLDIERESELLCLVTELHDIEVDLILVLLRARSSPL